MSEHEFEAYLNLLARTLRLSPKQRDRIAGELRDHMEQRLDELTTAGVERHDAALQALDEFGDATALAHELTTTARLKTRRHLMQTTFATAAVAAAVTLGVMYLAPSNYQGRPSQPLAAADQAEAASAPETARAEPAPQKRVDAHFEDNRLEDVVDWFAEQLGVNVHVDWTSLEEAGVERDLPVDMKLRNVEPEAAFELLLRTYGRGSLACEAVDEGLWLLTTIDRARPEIVSRGYDLTDLLQLRRVEVLGQHSPGMEMSGMGMGGMGMGGMGMGGMGMGGSYGGRGRGGLFDEPDANAALANVVRDALPRQAWHIEGTGVVAYDGVLIVRQTNENHRELQRTLAVLEEMLRVRAELLRAQQQQLETERRAERERAQSRRGGRESGEYGMGGMGMGGIGMDAGTSGMGMGMMATEPDTAGFGHGTTGRATTDAPVVPTE